MAIANVSFDSKDSEGKQQVKQQKMEQKEQQQQQQPPIRDIKFVGNSGNTDDATTCTGNTLSIANKSNRANDSLPDPVIDTTFHRAIHKVRLSALEHNYSEVESAANRQKCSVIVVVKADGYGHGSIPTALYLAEFGADAFAVATLQEGIALRKALQETASTTLGCDDNINHYFNSNQNILAGNCNFTTPNGISESKEQQLDSMSFVTNSAFSTIYGVHRTTDGGKNRRSLRQPHIRILVLGPPVGFPRCFDDYYHYNIEAMISGQEVAMALYEWICNEDERKRLQVERAANDLKEQILLDEHGQKLRPNTNIINTNSNSNNTFNQINRESIMLKSKQNGDISSSTLTTATTARRRKDKDNEDDETNKSETCSQSSSFGRVSSGSNSSSSAAPQQQIPSATLTNVTGSDLAREVREILKNQKLAVETQKQQQQHQQIQQQKKQHRKPSCNPGEQTPTSTDSLTVTPVSSSQDMTRITTSSPLPPSCKAIGGIGDINYVPVQVFAGIEETARHSRIRQKAMSKEIFQDNGGDDGDDISQHECNELIDNQRRKSVSENDGASVVASEKQATTNTSISTPHRTSALKNTNRKCQRMTKKRLRWHALVDSGMGRLGFRTDAVSREDNGGRRDSVATIKELVDLENNLDCPVEFYGMCTHMADASNKMSDYTNCQINKFKSLLKRVRAAGISVPTISTDNSAALLTTNLTHFDSKELLTQDNVDSRGFVRTGGAIYGQRPSFSQLRAISTLMASVRHVAVLRKGETVGYDRAYVAPFNVRIATLTIGFADGYPRELGNGIGRVSIRGHLFPVAGNVCMDMLMVELGSAEEKDGIGAEVVVGDTAILWGPDDGEEGEGHVRLQDVAAILKTTQSALTCGLNKERVLRQYSH